MVKLTYEGEEFSARPEESVLETLQRRGIEVPSSCRTGTCCICLLRQIDRPPPPEVQVGLRPGLRDNGYFLSCRYYPHDDIVVAPPRDADLFSRATVHAKEWLSPSICRVLLEPATPLYYHAGQFLNLRRADGLIRSYSLASVPALDRHLEVQVKRQPDGVMSQWIFDTLQVGDELEFQGPSGRSYYFQGKPSHSMLMLGTGTGLSPLVGIVRDALHSGHSGPMHLYHGSRHPDGHYLHTTLLDLAEQHDNFHYTPCVSGEVVEPGFVTGRVEALAFADHHDLDGWQVYLCGRPEMVYNSRELALQAGANPLDIHADPHSSSVRSPDEAARTPYPEPDPELWTALGEGVLLTAILTDFYNKVYADSRLSKFFVGVAKERAIEKQYNFLYKVFTGEDVYFGESPRTSHHWMVISDDLFDYREELMAESMRICGLSKSMMRRWRVVHERYRKDIVKSAPFPKVVEGAELPLDGFGDLTLDQGGVCDVCEGVIPMGQKIRYHLRLGTIYCHDCIT